MKECELQQNKMETEQIFWRLNLPLEGHIPRTKMPQFVFNFPAGFIVNLSLLNVLRLYWYLGLAPLQGFLGDQGRQKRRIKRFSKLGRKFTSSERREAGAVRNF